MHSTLISAEALASLLPGGNIRIFDVRHDLADARAGERAWRESRIPGAIHLDVERELAGVHTASNGRHPLPSRADFHRLLVEAGVGKNTQVVAYDAQGGAMAARLWWMVRWLGHEAVAVLDGGWNAWCEAGLPVEDQPFTGKRVLPGAVAEPLALGASLVDTVSADQIVHNLHVSQPGFVVLDARARARYRGEIEPLDPVAGHIPGALNHPSTENLDAHGRFKSPDALRAAFAAVLNGHAPNTVVHQCGSGITACHNMLAMEYAGLHGSRLYPGSWSEWCSDPVRPVA